MGESGGVALRIPFFTPRNQAKDVRRFVEDGGNDKPWTLGLAQKCIDFRSGVWLHYPFSGGAWEQDAGLLDLVRQAWRVWYVVGYMPDNKIDWTSDDAEFLAWIDNDGSTD